MNAIPYGQGTPDNGGCEDCWKVPARHCCLSFYEQETPDEDGGATALPALGRST